MYRFSLLFLALVGCAEELTVETLEEDAAARIEGTPVALGVLDLLNHEGTTFDKLDNTVGLDRRAARSLIHFRDGADGVYGTRDDQPFQTMAEVDDQYYVGKRALNALEDYAQANNWVVTNPDDILGVYDNVEFTLAEAEATLEFVNKADAAYLDDDLALNSRAVTSIVDARPVGSVQTLSELYYVGRSALTTLRDAANVEDAADTPFADDFTQDTADEIPDGDFTGLVTRTHVIGVPDHARTITVQLDIRHEDTTQLEVELTAPNGARYLLWDFEPHPEMEHRLDGDWDFGSSANGYWSLTVRDLHTGVVGESWGWNLHVES
jgi:hypothetical protein